MILYFCLILALIFTITNYLIDGYDIFNPSVIFCGMIMISLCMCVIYQPFYGFVLHSQTMFVITFGMALFTVFNYMSVLTTKAKKKAYCFSIIKPHALCTLLLICIEILTLVATRSYVRYVAGVYGRSGSYSSCLNMYNHISKFTEHFIDGSLRSKPKLMTIGEPISSAVAIIFIIIMINNLFAKAPKKQMLLNSIPILLDIMICLSRGSRSGAFTIITGILFVYYTFWHYKSGYKKGQLKFLFYVVLFGLGAIGAFTLLRTFIGRAASSIRASLFPYIGGPIVNLDIFLQSKWSLSSVFGSETFIFIIRYIGQKIHKSEWIYTANLPFNSLNGINLGNVYTTFYAWAQDFGYVGIIVLFTFMAMYYMKRYNKIKNQRMYILSVQFITYVYLFNSLIMLMFSNRFYEDLCNPVYIKMIICVFVIKYFLVEGGINDILHLRLVLRKAKI